MRRKVAVLNCVVLRKGLCFAVAFVDRVAVLTAENCVCLYFDDCFVSSSQCLFFCRVLAALEVAPRLHRGRVDLKVVHKICEFEVDWIVFEIFYEL